MTGSACCPLSHEHNGVKRTHFTSLDACATAERSRAPLADQGSRASSPPGSRQSHSCSCKIRFTLSCGTMLRSWVTGSAYCPLIHEHNGKKPVHFSTSPDAYEHGCCGAQRTWRCWGCCDVSGTEPGKAVPRAGQPGSPKTSPACAGSRGRYLRRYVHVLPSSYLA